MRKREKEEQHSARHSILTAAKLIAPAIENSFANGFDWYNRIVNVIVVIVVIVVVVIVIVVVRCIEVVKSSQHSGLASELEVTKSLMFLRENDTTKVVYCWCLLLVFIVYCCFIVVVIIVVVYCCCYCCCLLLLLLFILGH